MAAVFTTIGHFSATTGVEAPTDYNRHTDTMIQIHVKYSFAINISFGIRRHYLCISRNPNLMSLMIILSVYSRGK